MTTVVDLEAANEIGGKIEQRMAAELPVCTAGRFDAPHKAARAKNNPKSGSWK